ncbi:acyl carrier protein [Cystobacter ferrugineus]|uniref:Beta-ketoacyl synthase n=1 Tax=Cystobacter ferrugineus TaxID=83449 RepID=A0A1L9BCA5_9BACT|nr:acyl carrier protein [Cystobacter ferrugineus]OJH39894.1 beta-ketoacyl synthase [Cystobacter ferrugineus]
MSVSAEDEELLAVIEETLPPDKARRVRPEAALRQLGIDSLNLVIIVGRFLERYPVPVEPLRERLGSVRTVGELLDLGRMARSEWRRGTGHV